MALTVVGSPEPEAPALDRDIVEALRQWRLDNPRAVRLALDATEVDALLRVIDSTTIDH